MRRLLFINQFDQGIRETKLGIGILAFGGKSGAAYQRIIGPEHQGEGVEEKYTFIHGSKVGISPQSTVGSRQPTVGSLQSVLLRFNSVIVPCIPPQRGVISIDRRTGNDPELRRSEILKNVFRS